MASPGVSCGLCNKSAEGYTHERTVIFVDGNREFGPERVVVQPCGCVIDFPEFATEEVSTVQVDDQEAHIYGVIIADAISREIILEFDDQFMADFDDGDLEGEDW